MVPPGEPVTPPRKIVNPCLSTSRPIAPSRAARAPPWMCCRVRGRRVMIQKKINQSVTRLRTRPKVIRMSCDQSAPCHPTKPRTVAPSPVPTALIASEPITAIHRPARAARSESRRRSDAGLRGGIVHCAETASRRLNIHQVPAHRAASRPRPATVLRCPIAALTTGSMVSNSSGGTARAMRASRVASSEGLRASTYPAVA
jgi:hypothetical protein